MEWIVTNLCVLCTYVLGATTTEQEDVADSDIDDDENPDEDVHNEDEDDRRPKRESVRYIFLRYCMLFVCVCVFSDDTLRSNTY